MADKGVLRMKPHCPICGYTKKDALTHMDHHLCKGNIPGWEKNKKAEISDTEYEARMREDDVETEDFWRD